MITKKKTTSNKGKVVVLKGEDSARVLDAPKKGAPLVCELKAGEIVEIISKARSFYEIRVTNMVTGFIAKDNLKVE